MRYMYLLLAVLFVGCIHNKAIEKPEKIVVDTTLQYYNTGTNGMGVIIDTIRPEDYLVPDVAVLYDWRKILINNHDLSMDYDYDNYVAYIYSGVKMTTISLHEVNVLVGVQEAILINDNYGMMVTFNPRYDVDRSIYYSLVEIVESLK